MSGHAVAYTITNENDGVRACGHREGSPGCELLSSFDERSTENAFLASRVAVVGVR